MAEQRDSIWVTDGSVAVGDPATAANSVGLVFGEMTDSLTRMARTVLALLGRAGAGDGSGLAAPAAHSPRSVDLIALQPLIQTVLDDFSGLVTGAGFVAEPGVLCDCEYWVEWRMEWQGTFRRLEVSLDDPAGFDRYDYLHAAWFHRPRSGDTSTLTGPYVDLGGLNKYLVTLTIPVRDGESFLGVVGVDILVDRIEAVLRQMSRAMNVATTILNADGRVIAASVPQLHPGALAHGVDLTVADGQLAAPGFSAYRCGPLPWTLLASPPTVPVRQLLRNPNSGSG
ncbi:MAG: hypothetical protein FWD74_04475 [Actinomycetia bacterium]|nr:hypothetical protein [Actinomycetes bacterium]